MTHWPEKPEVEMLASLRLCAPISATVSLAVMLNFSAKKASVPIG
jgi:hypothetical protein